MSDRELLNEYLANRSEPAFGQLVDRHLAFVYHVCRREIEDQQAAEDAALAVFLLLAKKAPTIRPGVSLTTWLFSAARLTAKNAAREERRRKAREQRASEMAYTQNQLRQDQATPFVDTYLNEALAALSEHERTAVLLRYQDDLGVADVGKALGISESAAQMRLSRALAKLRRLFGAKGATLSIGTLAAALIAVRAEAAPATLAAKASAANAAGWASGAGPAADLLYKGALKTMRVAKIKMAAALAAAIVLVGGLGTLAVYRAKASTMPEASQNAFDYFNLAGQMVHKYNGDDTLVTSKDPAYDSALIAENEQALEIMREGFGYPYSRSQITYSTRLPYLSGYRTLSKMLVVESRVRARAGDVAGAANSGLDAIELGEMMPSGNAIIGSFVGNTCDSFGRGAVWAQMQNLTASQALAIDERLIGIESQRLPLSASIQSEEGAVRSWPWAPGPAAERDSYLAFLAQWEQVADEPYGARPALPAPPEASDPLTDEEKRLVANPDGSTPPNPTVADMEIANPGLVKIWLRYIVDEAYTRELEVALALQAYRLDTGSYPGSLSDLVPHYLPNVPDDPFAAPNTPLCYKNNGDSYLLYSVGPDGADNGGHPILGGRPGQMPPISLESRGDIAAGGADGW